ncbi:MAG: peptidase M48 [Alteromonadaceae bacterium]|nr:MAG: peptidase M48 [Alteromonadaceae bacterium]
MFPIQLAAPYRVLALITYIIVSCTACAVNPVTGKNELSLVSSSQEIAMGQKNYSPYQQQQGGVYNVDPELGLYVANVGRKLAQLSHSPNLPYEFVVLNNDGANAWALPGGKIAVNRGLLLLLDDEAQLAAVLGHEIVHAAARHGAQQMTKATLISSSIALLGAATKDTSYGSILSQGTQLGAGAWQAKHGREHELQSDAHGMDYMVNAGYDPYAAVELQETFVKLSESRAQSNWLQGLFASHPPSQERVDKNRQKASQLSGGVRNHSAYQRATAQIRKDKSAYELSTQALKQATEGNHDSALRLIDRAIAAQDEEALFHTQKGVILLAQKNYQAAESAFTQASRLYPEYFKTQLGLGIAQLEQGKTREAKTHLQLSLDLLPTPNAAYQLGEVAIREGNQSLAAQYFSQVAQSGGELGAKAQQRLNQIQGQ